MRPVGRLFQIALVVWALGMVLAEGLAQAGAVLCIVVALLTIAQWRTGASSAVKQFAAAALLLAAWQAVSPAVALARGTSQTWPHSGRYWQWVDTLAPAALALITDLPIPWLAIAGVLALGWAINGLTAIYQHFVRWPFHQFLFERTPVDRVHEELGAPGHERYAAGGLLFHRLRLSHGAVALLGPALLFGIRERRIWVRALAVVVGMLLFVSIYMAFARAALIAALVILIFAVIWLDRGPARIFAAGLCLVLLIGIASSPNWRERVVTGEENITTGGRHKAVAAGIQLVKAHPLLGVGFGNHQEQAMKTAPTTGVDGYLATDSHNLWLTAWAETGFLGLLLTLAYHVLLARALWLRSVDGSWVAQGALLSFLGFHLLSLVHYLPYHTGVYLTFSFVWGLGLAPDPALSVEPVPGKAPAAAPPSIAA